MRRRVGAALVALGLLACERAVAPGVAAALPVEWQPADSRFYSEFHLLLAEGVLDTTVGLSFRPKARADLAALTLHAARRSEGTAHPGVTRLAREFSREFVLLGEPPAARYTPPLLSLPSPAGAAEVPPTAVRFALIPYLSAALERQFDGHTRVADRSAFGVRLGLALGPVLLYQDLFAGRYDGARRFSDALVSDTDFILYTEDVYLTARTPWLDFSLGRTRHALGPGPGATLLHSPEAGPMTHFTYTASLFGGRLAGRAFHGDVSAATGERLAEHGFEWTPTPAVQLSLFEAARYRSAQWEPLYVVSLIPFSLVQKMLEQDALGDTAQSDARNNVIAGLGARVRVTRGHLLYGELLVDDINLETSGAPVRVGYQLGWLGARSYGGRRVFGSFEWSRVNRYVYAVDYGENFIHQERPIGFPLGPDVRAFSLAAGYDVSADWRLTVSGALADQGEGTLGEFYDSSGPPASGGTLGGVVESTRLLGAGIAWTPRDGIEVGADGAGRWRDDVGHVAGASDSGFGFRLRVLFRH